MEIGAAGAAILVGLAAAVLTAHSLVWNFVTDDAYISFVYARNLANHGQLVFNLGERVEGYTNFLWTVILAGLYKVGLPPEHTSRVLGTVAAIVTLFLCARWSRRLRTAEADASLKWSALWDALPALFLAGVPGFACWASGGLETQLFTMLLTWGLVLTTEALLDGQDRGRSPSVPSAVAFGLAALTRPEGLLFFALAGLIHGADKLRRRSLAPTAAELKWLAIFCAMVAPHLLWRRWYYGWWLPNTFYIKASGGAGTWAQGAYYLGRFTEQFHLWVIPFFVVGSLFLRTARASRAIRTLYAVALPVVAVFLVYVASVGGDFMGLFRFAMPIVPLLAVVTAVALRSCLAFLPGRSLKAAAVAVLLCAHGWHARAVDRQSLVIGADRGIDSPGFLRWYTADRAAIGKWFGRYASPDDYAAVGGAGAQVYYSGMRSLDCFGLSDEYIAHRVRPVSNRPGHQKYAPLDYQLQKKPTIITSNYYRIAHAPYVPPPFEAAEWRSRGYRYVNAQVPGLSSPWYAFLLRDDRQLGPIEATAPGIAPPGDLD
jgi:hypothetical protein